MQLRTLSLSVGCIPPQTSRPGAVGGGCFEDFLLSAVGCLRGFESEAVALVEILWQEVVLYLVAPTGFRLPPVLLLSARVVVGWVLAEPLRSLVCFDEILELICIEACYGVEVHGFRNPCLCRGPYWRGRFLLTGF